MFCRYELYKQGNVFSCRMKLCLYIDGALVGSCSHCVHVRFEIFGSIYVFLIIHVELYFLKLRVLYIHITHPQTHTHTHTHIYIYIYI